MKQDSLIKAILIIVDSLDKSDIPVQDKLQELKKELIRSEQRIKNCF